MSTPLLVACDHAGLELKEHLKGVLRKMQIPFEDLGTHSAESVDYPDYARLVAEAVSTGRAERGLLVCGTGQGMAMTANRYRGVRAAVPCTEETARLVRAHNDSNVLALGGRTVTPERAEAILRVWLETPHEGGRHARRVAKIESER